MALEPIKRLVFADPDKMRVQSDAIASAEAWTERHIGRYRALDGAFGGRYIAADLFKETFAEYAAGREGRARYNVAVHNASAVLSAELYRRVLGEGDGRTRAVFLTGIPGAGKTTSVLVQGGLAPDTRLVFEGQMWRPDSTFPKLQQALDAGLEPVLLVVHPHPEYALRNTFRRFSELGRGASIDTMANIQGGLPDGLEAVRDRFGETVRLIVHDARDPDARRILAGWQNLPLLRSEGTRERIHQRLVAELERAEREGAIGVSHRQQALGEARDPGGMAGRLASEAGGARSQRDLEARARAEAFLILEAEEGVRRHPELAPAYAALHAAARLAEGKMSRPADQIAFVERVRTRLGQQLEAGAKIDIDRAQDRPVRER
jgi:hypothetical protein